MFGFFKEIKDLRRRVELLEGEHLSDEARSYYQQKYEKSRKRNYAKAKKLVMEKGIKLYSDVFRKYRSSGDLCLSKNSILITHRWEIFVLAVKTLKNYGILAKK